LLSRAIPTHFRVRPGRAQHLDAVLTTANVPRDAYAIRPTKSTAYVDDDGDEIIVVTESGIESVLSHSFALNAYSNRPETEYLLVVLNNDMEARIADAAKLCTFSAKDVQKATMK